LNSYLAGSGGENWRGLKIRAEGGFKRFFSCAAAKVEKKINAIRTNITGLLLIISLEPLNPSFLNPLLLHQLSYCAVFILEILFCHAHDILRGNLFDNLQVLLHVSPVIGDRLIVGKLIGYP